MAQHGTVESDKTDPVVLRQKATAEFIHLKSDSFREGVLHVQLTLPSRIRRAGGVIATPPGFETGGRFNEAFTPQ